VALAGCASGSPPGTTGDAGGGVDASVAPDAGPGDAGEDAAAVEMVGLCEECVVHEQCGSLARCIPLTGPRLSG